MHISQKIAATLSPNTISEILRDIGKDYASKKEFFDELIVDSKTLIFDLRSIFSYSEFTEIDYDWRLDYTFSYRKRGIKWGRKRIGANFLYLYEKEKHRGV